jgi:hypothetical protein
VSAWCDSKMVAMARATARRAAVRQGRRAAAAGVLRWLWV